MDKQQIMGFLFTRKRQEAHRHKRPFSVDRHCSVGTSNSVFFGTSKRMNKATHHECDAFSKSLHFLSDHKLWFQASSRGEVNSAS